MRYQGEVQAWARAHPDLAQGLHKPKLPTKRGMNGYVLFMKDFQCASSFGAAVHASVCGTLSVARAIACAAAASLATLACPSICTARIVLENPALYGSLQHVAFGARFTGAYACARFMSCWPEAD